MIIRPTPRGLQRHSTTLAVAALVVTLATCSSVPDRNIALDEARVRHASVRSDVAVTTHAGEELRRADAALPTAEADAAQRILAASEMAGARKTAELEAAERAAAADHARLASSAARVDSLERQLQAMNARKTERGMVVALGDVLFDTGRSQLQSDGGRSMQQLAEFMRRYPQRQASIEGYTDDVGSATSNLELSDRRARSVMTALMGMGIGAERLKTRGFGEAHPVGENSSSAGRRMNRCVEVISRPNRAPCRRGEPHRQPDGRRAA